MTEEIKKPKQKRTCVAALTTVQRVGIELGATVSTNET
jgi:hypothetical protein